MNEETKNVENTEESDVGEILGASLIVLIGLCFAAILAGVAVLVWLEVMAKLGGA